ncbi:16S rRNA (cytidine(1402)-2'-O)-methyltransferase [Pseudooceanicola sp. C21-150M6]|uniref:16S rRNA (cytidine(1402)-2'-O)-methyltransferase n=1 Tax=Pseudooceanicola sp. C21-150M6 TaxID=3434355 RepID=UPI003D7FBEC0
MNASNSKGGVPELGSRPAQGRGAAGPAGATAGAEPAAAPVTGLPAGARPADPGLTLIAVPIGAARDITLHALDVLISADVLAAEDTRSLRKLMEIHGIALRGRHIVAYHDHNGDRARPGLLAAMAEGKSVAYASEAGTPLIADPGFDLARAARAAGYHVTTAPGVSAVVTALSLAGLPTDRFYFGGFLPSQAKARQTALKSLVGIEATLVFYESPNRLVQMLDAAAEALGAERTAAVCRELTKKFEEVRTGTLSELSRSFQQSGAKGEIVVVIDRGEPLVLGQEEVSGMLRDRLQHGDSVKDAVRLVMKDTGWARRDVYQLALEVTKTES